MLLLAGPPGSGKTSSVLDRVKESARRGRDDVRLLVPTATMAEHLRNQVARAGLLVRPRAIQTLWRFVESVVSDLPPAPEATWRFLVRSALEAEEARAFGEIRSLPGFQAAVANLLEELSEAGVDASGCRRLLEGEEFGGALHAVFARVEAEVRSRGLFLRAERLRVAAERIAREGLSGVDAVLFDGFFSFTNSELELIRALSRRVETVLTLPEWAGAARIRAALEEQDFEERRCERVRARPAMQWFAAPNLVRETEEVARRVIEMASAGRLFREIGVVVRGFSPYVPALRTTFERLGIPARFYFAETLKDHPAAQRIVRVVEAKLGGWDHEETLGALRLGMVSAELDRFEFAVLERIPGRGLEQLVSWSGDGRLRAMIESFRALDSWPDGPRAASEWGARLKSLTGLFPPPRVHEGATHELAALWRSYAAALAGYEAAIEETAAAVGGRTLTLEEFWREAKVIMAMSAVRPQDRRRNVVHVMDVYEARQWELPVVFVCGLLERQFPRHHTEDPLLGDATRRRLRLSGVYLPTTEERTAEERFLFELAASRATELLVLSYPQYDQRGEETLRAFWWEDIVAEARKEAVAPVRVRAARERPPAGRPVVAAPELLARLQERHARLSPSSIELFLQCPFQFFAARTLRLAGPPAPPAERLDARTQGEIVHAVLRELAAGGGGFERVFERLFEEKCREKNVPAGYRREAIRLEMLRNLGAFDIGPGQWWGQDRLAEQDFEFALADGLVIRGRIDRLELLPDGRALVIDYKYSSSSRMREIISGNREGSGVQAGLYLLATRRAFGYDPAGVLFCTLRQEVAWDGWHAPVAGLERVGEVCEPKMLTELMESAAARSQDAARGIFAGRIEPVPAERSICRTCDYRDVCRVDERELVVLAGGGGA